MPSILAAWPLLPPALSRAFLMKADSNFMLADLRSRSLNSEDTGAALSPSITSRGRCSTEMDPSFCSTASRSIRFESSRTLPGQL
jgi:hypothetical protein